MRINIQLITLLSVNGISTTIAIIYYQQFVPTMLNKTEVFFAILLGVVYGTKALLDKKEKPFIAILISIVLIYIVAGTKIGYRPLNFILFAAAVTFWYNVFFFIGKLGIRLLSAGYKLIVEAITLKFKSIFS